MQRWCYRNVAMTTRNYGRDAVKGEGVSLTSPADAAQTLVECIVLRFICCTMAGRFGASARAANRIKPAT
jgi:hypothetical protein